jgi:tetratricopeptide (TPR) repeat protein
MQRLAELFLQDVGANPKDEEACEKAVAKVDAMCSQPELTDGVSPGGMFCLLGLSLEDKSHFVGAAACFRRALNHVLTPEWERAVLLQQLGKVLLRATKPAEAKPHLKEAIEIAEELPDVPSTSLFGGAFSCSMDKSSYTETSLNLLAKACYDTGSMEDAKKLREIALNVKARHEEEKAKAEEAKRLAAIEAAKPSALWAKDMREAPLGGYTFADGEGTFFLYVSIEHLQGAEVRVEPGDEGKSILIRARAADWGVEKVLWLAPLANEIVPEDTVHKMRKSGLKVTLFKREKKRRVYSLLDLQEKPIPRKRKEFAQDLTEEELAKLPQPSEGTHDNLPSSFTATNKGAVGKLPEPVAKSTDNLPSVAKAPASTPNAAATSPSAEGSAADAPAPVAASAPKLDDQQLPGWVEGVDQLQNEIRVRVALGIELADLSVEEQDAEAWGHIRITRAGAEQPLHLAARSSVASVGWSKRKQQLTLRLA